MKVLRQFDVERAHCEQTVQGQSDIHMSHIQKMNLNPYLPPYTKIDSKWSIDLNIRAKIITLSEKNIGENLGDLGLGKEFIDITLKA